MTFALVISTSMKMKVGQNLPVEMFNFGMPLVLLGWRLRKTHALMVQSVVLLPSPVSIGGGVLDKAAVQYTTAQDLHWSRGFARARSRSATVKVVEVQPKRVPTILPDSDTLLDANDGASRIATDSPIPSDSSQPSRTPVDKDLTPIVTPHALVSKRRKRMRCVVLFLAASELMLGVSFAAVFATFPPPDITATSYGGNDTRPRPFLPGNPNNGSATGENATFRENAMFGENATYVGSNTKPQAPLP
jgi:hypothetical protein